MDILEREIESTGIEQYSVLGICEHENKPSFSINCCRFLEELRNYIPLNRSCTSELIWGAHTGSCPIFFKPSVTVPIYKKGDKTS